MNNNQSFLFNLIRGISMRFKKLFQSSEGFRISRLYKIYLKHLPADKIHSAKLFKREFKFRGGPDYLNGLEEIFADEVYKQSLPENAFILDCGSHIGMSIVYLKRICPTAEIIGFEPDKKNFELLSHNINSFDLDKVTLVNKAVWNQNTTLNFASEGDMTSRIIEDGKSENPVEACRLFDYLDRKVDFLKMDIEGAEYEVVKDLEPRMDKIHRMFIEYHGLFNQNTELLEILHILNRNNFNFYIKEAGPVYPHPFTGIRNNSIYDVQLNIFCIKKVN